MNVGDFYRVTHVCQQAEQIGLMVSHWRVGSLVVPGPTDEEVAKTMDTLFGATIKALVSTQTTYRGTLAQKVFPLPVLARAQSTLIPGPGTAVGNTLPRQTAGLIWLSTAIAGRAGRGRKYAPFPAAGDDQADGTPTADYRIRLLTLATLFGEPQTIVGVLGNANVVPCIWHRANPALSPLITTSGIRTVWATQRRRGSFGRPNTSPI